MAHRHSMRDLLHLATHRVPGVPAHTERAPGHRWNHSQPTGLGCWWAGQTRIAAFFGQALG